MDSARLAAQLEGALPEAVFAYLMGSAAKNFVVPPHGDLDIAIYVAPNAQKLRMYEEAQRAVVTIT